LTPIFEILIKKVTVVVVVQINRLLQKLKLYLNAE
jgi:hypothetical protein